MFQILRSRLLSPKFIKRIKFEPVARPLSSAKKESKNDDSKTPKLKIKATGKVDEVHKEEGKKEKVKEEDIAASAGQRAMYVTKVGAGANLALAISKGTIGISIASTGLIADAANSLGDLLSDAVVYFSVREARKTATPDRPWGRGKVEPLGKCDRITRSNQFLNCAFF